MAGRWNVAKHKDTKVKHVLEVAHVAKMGVPTCIIGYYINKKKQNKKTTLVEGTELNASWIKRRITDKKM